MNCGSSSLKVDLIDTAFVDANRWLVRAEARGIGAPSGVFAMTRPQEYVLEQATADHAAAFARLFDWIAAEGLLRGGIDAVGHRVVHGGARFDWPVLLDDSVLAGITAASALAPLHNARTIEVVSAARERLGRDIPMVATFDTAFFADLPEVARRYAIPRDLTDRLNIRRYGFHGLAHRFMVEQFSDTHGYLTRPRVITLQLGGGCSATASVAGRPIDTSMGFTPLDGLIMGTRSGSIDPSIPLYLVSDGKTPGEVSEILNNRSGLLALSGSSPDVGTLLAAGAAGDAHAEAAIEAFCYSLKKCIGAFAAALGGIDGVVFGGGIGENSAEIRSEVCRDMGWCGIQLDESANALAPSAAWRIDQGVGAEVWAVRVDEALVIATDTEACLGGHIT